MIGVVWRFATVLPAALGEAFALGDGAHLNPLHRFAKTRGNFGEDGGVLPVRGCLHNGDSGLGWVLRLEDARANEDAISTSLERGWDIVYRGIPLRG